MHAKTPSRAPGLIFSFLAGFGIFSFGWLLDRLLQYAGVNRRAIAFDDLFVGVIVGLLVLYYEERRRRMLIEKLKTIELMNHHVRNALQVIAYARYTPDMEKQVRIVTDSVERIEWALKEVLPGGAGTSISQRRSKPAA